MSPENKFVSLIVFFFVIVPLLIVLSVSFSNDARDTMKLPTCASEEMPKIANVTIDHTINVIIYTCGKKKKGRY